MSERLWCRARSGSTGFRGLGGFGAELGQVHRVPEKVPEKVCKALVQSQVRFNRGEGSGEGQVQQDLRPFNSRKPS